MLEARLSAAPTPSAPAEDTQQGSRTTVEDLHGSERVAPASTGGESHGLAPQGCSLRRLQDGVSSHEKQQQEQVPVRMIPTKSILQLSTPKSKSCPRPRSEGFPAAEEGPLLALRHHLALTKQQRSSENKPTPGYC